MDLYSSGGRRNPLLPIKSHVTTKSRKRAVTNGAQDLEKAKQASYRHPFSNIDPPARASSTSPGVARDRVDDQPRKGAR